MDVVLIDGIINIWQKMEASLRERYVQKQSTLLSLRHKKHVICITKFTYNHSFDYKYFILKFCNK